MEICRSSIQTNITDTHSVQPDGENKHCLVKISSKITSQLGIRFQRICSSCLCMSRGVSMGPHIESKATQRIKGIGVLCVLHTILPCPFLKSFPDRPVEILPASHT